LNLFALNVYKIGGNLLPNLSKIDIKKIKLEEIKKKRSEKVENIEDLIAGIDPN